MGSVLDYARPTKGNPAPVDVNGVVRRTVQILSSDRDDEVALELDLAEDLPRIRVDAEQLRQVLMNLVRNATQAMNGRGRVVLGTRAAGRGTDRKGGWVELRVTDSGPGHFAEGPEEPVRALLHHQKPGNRARSGHQPAARPERGRHHRGQHPRRARAPPSRSSFRPRRSARRGPGRTGEVIVERFEPSPSTPSA